MVKFYQHTSSFEHAWDNVTYAFWLRYPNPFASHVVGCDVIDRQVDPHTGVLRTTRLIHKQGVLPRWGRHLIKSADAYIIEESVVDPRTQTMVTRTKNLNHVRVMQVEETQTFTVHPENPKWTQVKTEARIISELRWGLTGRVEHFGVNKFMDNSVRARKGMAHILERLRHNAALATAEKPAPAV
ncbi:MAG: PRELI-like family-domain-containing protein [Benniella sp.]|nr:MAG: PRELI-like family-domain-containing protein [Benniella sp.]